MEAPALPPMRPCNEDGDDIFREFSDCVTFATVVVDEDEDDVEDDKDSDETISCL